MNILEAIKNLENHIANPKDGLPEEVFLFVSRIIPMVNVDLLIKDENKRTLLAWRNDEFCGTGWHIPGGIIRYKEKIETRIQKVAEVEIGAIVKFNPIPISYNEIIINEQKTRGHFISMLFNCFLSEKYIPHNIGINSNDAGYLAWHKSCPDNLIKLHEIYRNYI